MKLFYLPTLTLALLASSAFTIVAQPSYAGGIQRNGLFQNTKVEKAWETAIATKKPLLVMFTSDHCVYCRKMLTETYGHPAIQQMLTGRTETALAHANDYSDLVKRMGIRGFPTSLLISPQGKVLDVMEGFVEPREFAQRMQPLISKASRPSNLDTYGNAATANP